MSKKPVSIHIDCIDDKVAGVSAVALQMLEFLTEEDEDNG